MCKFADDKSLDHCDFLEYFCVLVQSIGAGFLDVFNTLLLVEVHVLFCSFRSLIEVGPKAFMIS